MAIDRINAGNTGADRIWMPQRPGLFMAAGWATSTGASL
jgi:hypothetical protein